MRALLCSTCAVWSGIQYKTPEINFKIISVFGLLTERVCGLSTWNYFEIKLKISEKQVDNRINIVYN